MLHTTRGHLQLLRSRILRAEIDNRSSLWVAETVTQVNPSQYQTDRGKEEGGVDYCCSLREFANLHSHTRGASNIIIQLFVAILIANE